jgi:hypothetical protein
MALTKRWAKEHSGTRMKGSDVVAITALAISLTALLWNVAVMWLKWPRIVVEVAVRRPPSPMAGEQKQGGVPSSEDEAFVLTIINNGAEPVSIISMGFKGSGTDKKFRLDYLDTWRAPTGAELPKRRGAEDEPVLPVRIQGHDCHVYEYTESALLELPPDVDYHGYAQRYKAFRWRPNRPMVRETKSRETVLRHGVRAAVAAGFHGGEISPFQEAGRDSHDG